MLSAGYNAFVCVVYCFVACGVRCVMLVVCCLLVDVCCLLVVAG